jgi:hypothetical protein
MIDPEKDAHVKQLETVLEAVLATGIPATELPPLLCAVAGLLLGEACAKEGATPGMNMGLAMITLAMRVTARMAVASGNRDDVLRELREAEPIVEM